MDWDFVPSIDDSLGFPNPSLNSKRKTILVAGGAGFVGSHLCEALLSLGHSVICIDNLQTGHINNIASFADNARFTFIQMDIVERVSVSGAINEVYNLACAASPQLYQNDPIHTFRTCTTGVLNLLDLAKAKGARILQASSSEVYGDPEISPQPESYRGCVNTVGPRACYDEGKRAAEMLFWEYGEHQGVETRIARIFNTYGPRMRPLDGRVVSNFIVQALTGKPLTIYGSGQQTRSFCYVDDLVEGMMRLMASDTRQPVNLGNPGEFTMLELADKVLSMTGSKSQLITCQLPVDDPRQRKPDIRLASELLGWAPTIALDQGLQRTIEHFRRELRTNEFEHAIA